MTWCKACRAKYERDRRAARLGTFTAADIARFWSRVDKNGPVFEDLGPCWVWQGASRNKLSAVLPISSRASPVRPWVPTMIMSARFFLANSAITFAGAPVSTAH